MVHAGRETTGLRIVLAPCVSFAGQVTDSSDRPVQGATVALIGGKSNGSAGMIQQFMPDMMQAKEGSAVSDPDGRFTIANVAPGDYVISATHPRYAKTTHKDVRVQAGHDVTGYRITLLAAGCVGGYVLINGEPKAGVTVHLIGGSGMEMTTTDSDGRFEICGLAPDSYLVQAIDLTGLESDDFSADMRQQVSVEVREGEHTEVSFAPAPDSVAVSGVVTGERGTTTVVTLRREEGILPEESDFRNMDMAALLDQLRYQVGETVVAGDGSFKIEGVPPGTYILEVASIDFDPVNWDPQSFDLEAVMESSLIPVLRREVTVEPGKPLHLELDLPPAE